MASVIVEVNNFEQYIKSLSKKARKNYAYVQKHNTDLEYRCIPYDSKKVEQFMRLWERQLIHGKNITWAFPIGTVDGWAKDGVIMLFEAVCKGETIGLHFIQKRDGYWECHPPMYDKTKYAKRYLAKYMWFSLFKYANEHNLGKMDMGGADDPNYQYKLIYLP